jgi:hypothetical protein
LLCSGGSVTSLVDLTLEAERRRGHGALYDGLNNGRIEIARLRWVLAGLPVPRAAGAKASGLSTCRAGDPAAGILSRTCSPRLASSLLSRRR